MTAQEVMRLPDTTLLTFHRDNWPMRLSRLEWYTHPILVKRQSMPPPALKPLPKPELPHWQASQAANRHNERAYHLSAERQVTPANTLWQRHRKVPKGYLDPDERY